jgi:transforming growth factor-beta-induced protein
MMKSVLTAGLAAAAYAQGNIVQVAESDPNLRILVDAVVRGGLVSALEGPGPFTVFAPVDQAFDALGRNIVDYVFSPHNVKTLDAVLTYHVVSGKVPSSALKDGQVIPTLDTPETVTAHVSAKEVAINNAVVLKANVEASNGIIHIVDHVLVPSNFALPKDDILTTALAAPQLSTLVTAVKAANITAALAMPEGPYTVFAPTNDAFAKIPANELNYLLAHPDALRNVLFYHLTGFRVYAEEIANFGRVPTLNRQELIFFVNSSGVLINGVSKVIATNIDCTNGVVHLIDTVLIPNAVKVAAAAWAAAPTDNIVQLAEATPALSTLVKAVIAADLVTTLESAGPFTVFAPTDDAFKRLPEGVLAYLLANPATLKTVLLYHTVSGDVPSSALKDGEKVLTVAGFNATVRIFNDRHHNLIFIDDAQVIAADNAATNGVVHIIDNVILPPAVAAAAEVFSTSRRLRGSA